MTKRSATRRSVTAWRMAGLLAMPGLAMAAPPPSPERDPAAERQMKIGGSFTVAAVGDIIAPQPIVDGDPAFQALAERLRKADVGFANMETSLVDFRNFSGPVGGTLSPLATARSIRDMGVTLVSRANNHTFDGGLAGMISTDGALDRAGIAHAGTGRDLHEARAAQYLATPKGRVGLVSIFSIDDSSHYGPSFSRTEASYRNGGLGGAAGLNPLHLKAYHVVAPADFEALRAIAARAQGLREAAAPANPRRFRLFGQGYEVGSDVGDVRYEIDARDAAETMASIRNGKAYADFLIATIHAHQAASAAALEVGGAEHDPANFLVRLAHDAIDNGAGSVAKIGGSHR
jgi:Bacterial capsule synthesis protein PGA_cap